MQPCIFLLFSLPCFLSQPFSIDDYGAVPSVDTHAQALLNGAAFTAALQAANASTSQRAVLIPAGSVYSFLPSVPSHDRITNVTIFIEGTLNVSTANFWLKNNSGYPGFPDNPWNPLLFNDCSNLGLVSTTGKGLLNGRGNEWWWYTILVADHRANLLEVDTCTNLLIQGVSFLNSAAWHMNLAGQTNATVLGVTVKVDIEDQLDAYRYIGGAARGASLQEVLLASERIGPTTEAAAKEWVSRGSLTARSAAREPALQQARVAAFPPHISSLPWFEPSWRITPPIPMIWALNTDGIDFSGQGITVHNCSVTNFDDSVCVKPSNSPTGAASGCTTGVDIADIRVTYGVGVSMGSVPPDSVTDCIDGVSARRLHFDTPLKAMYLKPNPAKGDPGGDSGRIANVLYEDVEVRNALWWSLWLGTQQQHQPGGGGGQTDCPFIFPLLNTTCPSDPQVTVANITLRRVNLYGGIFSPGVIMCNYTNPGTGFLFDGVVAHNASTFPVPTGYLVQHVSGVATGGTFPVPAGFVVK